MMFLTDNQVALLGDVLAEAAARKGGRTDGQASEAEVVGLCEVYRKSQAQTELRSLLTKLVKAYDKTGGYKAQKKPGTKTKKAAPKLPRGWDTAWGFLTLQSEQNRGEPRFYFLEWHGPSSKWHEASPQEIIRPKLPEAAGTRWQTVVNQTQRWLDRQGRPWTRQEYPHG